MNFETENMEFKAQFTEEIYKEVIAFANTDGGVVYVGIDDNGNAAGLSNVDQEYTRITNGIRDAIMPDVTMFVRFSIQDNRVVRITVGEGSNKPYYLKGKGLKPSGVYVRQGASSVPASPEQIRQMIKESDGDTFEDMRSMKQDTECSLVEKNSVYWELHKRTTSCLQILHSSSLTSASTQRRLLSLATTPIRSSRMTRNLGAPFSRNWRIPLII